jgi:D-arabinose 1-dehydrogenase-like Zn-dependent alcohol dehydrogenase
VLARIHACGICGTDLWTAQGKLSYRPFPLILGHEGVGEVVAVVTGVTEFAIGDRIGMPHNGLEYLAEALGFVSRGEVTPMVEVFPKENINEAVAKAASGDMRFQAVVTY